MGDRLRVGKPSQYVTSHPGQLSLAIPSWVGAMSTSESWDVNRLTARCTSPVSVVWQCKLVSGWGLRKRSSTPSYGPYGSGRTSYTHILSFTTLSRLHTPAKIYTVSQVVQQQALGELGTWRVVWWPVMSKYSYENFKNWRCSSYNR